MSDYTAQDNTPKVYVIQQAGSGNCKIGVSIDPAQRLAKLQSSTPDPLIIRYVITPRGGVSAYALEGRLHTEFKHHRLKGEWFAVAPETVAEHAGHDFFGLMVERIDAYPRWVFHETPATERPSSSSRHTTQRVLFAFTLSALYGFVILYGQGAGQIELGTVELAAHWVMAVGGLAGLLILLSAELWALAKKQ